MFFSRNIFFKSSLELNHATKISFIQCFANEDSFMGIFKIFKNASVTSLTISEVFDCNQREPIDTNVAVKRIAIRNIKRE